MKQQKRKKRIIESGFVLLSAITLGIGVYSNSSSILLKPKAMIAEVQFEAIKNYDFMQVKNRLEERKRADIVILLSGCQILMRSMIQKESMKEMQNSFGIYAKN